MTFGGRQRLVEDDLRWKTTFGGRQPFVKDNLQQKTTVGGGQPSAEDDLCWILACCFSVLKHFLALLSTFLRQGVFESKKNIWQKLTRVPSNLEGKTFRTPLAILWCLFWIFEVLIERVVESKNLLSKSWLEGPKPGVGPLSRLCRPHWIFKVVGCSSSLDLFSLCYVSVLDMFSLGYVLVMDSRSLSFVTVLGMCSLDMLQSRICYSPGYVTSLGYGTIWEVSSSRYILSGICYSYPRNSSLLFSNLSTSSPQISCIRSPT